LERQLVATSVVATHAQLELLDQLWSSPVASGGLQPGAAPQRNGNYSLRRGVAG
jgi:hypothetical protein